MDSEKKRPDFRISGPALPRSTPPGWPRPMTQAASSIRSSAPLGSAPAWDNLGSGGAGPGRTPLAPQAPRCEAPAAGGLPGPPRQLRAFVLSSQCPPVLPTAGPAGGSVLPCSRRPPSLIHPAPPLRCCSPWRARRLAPGDQQEAGDGFRAKLGLFHKQSAGLTRGGGSSAAPGPGLASGYRIFVLWLPPRLASAHPGAPQPPCPAHQGSWCLYSPPGAGPKLLRPHRHPASNFSAISS